MMSSDLRTTFCLPKINYSFQTMTSLATVTLNSGFPMPVLGFGTATPPTPIPIPEDRLTETFLDGIKAGYRHFDTAALYGTEKALGAAIAIALRQGLILSRDELFITSKLWCSDLYPEAIIPALKRTLRNLGLEYLDLYLIHWPVRLNQKEVSFPDFGKEESLPWDIRSTWAAMEDCQLLGLVKSIGVSNFSSKKLTTLLSSARIPPSINRVEMNPAWNQKKLKEFCYNKGIHITAYSPLGAAGTLWGSNSVVDSLVLKNIADSKGKTIAQISLRWLYEQGVTAVVKSFNKERMKENQQIFDWSLSEEDKDKIDKLPQKKGSTGEEFLSPNGFCKKPEDIWDDEA